MFKRVLVASDLSDRSLYALRRAIHIAVRHNAELHVLHVVDDALPAPVAREVRSSTEAFLKTVVADTTDRLGERLRVDVRFGAVWKTILETAETDATNLIVLGSHRFRGIPDLFRGTTLERVARLSKVPVLMVPNEPTTDYQSILVGVDFSPASSAATTTAADLAPKSRITLVSSYHIPFKAFLERDEAGDDAIQAEKRRIERELKTRVSDFVQSLVGDTKRFRTMFVEGRAAQSLVELAEREEADLVCVGSHGRSWLTRTLLGSTAEELFYKAPCDVLVARTQGT